MDKKFIRKLQRTGSHSYAVNIPKELVGRFNWQEKQKIEIVANDRKRHILIKDWKGK